MHYGRSHVAADAYSTQTQAQVQTCSGLNLLPEQDARHHKRPTALKMVHEGAGAYMLQGKVTGSDLLPKQAAIAHKCQRVALGQVPGGCRRSHFAVGPVQLKRHMVEPVRIARVAGTEPRAVSCSNRPQAFNGLTWLRRAVQRLSTSCAIARLPRGWQVAYQRAMLLQLLEQRHR